MAKEAGLFVTISLNNWLSREYKYLKRNIDFCSKNKT